MEFIDTHSHIYQDAFKDDIEEVVFRARSESVSYILLPNIDATSVEALHQLAGLFPDVCLPMMGLHPTSVKENYLHETGIAENLLRTGKYIAVGEIGIDLYWDKTFLEEQKEVFARQILLAKELDLPFIIHARDSFPEIFEVLERLNFESYRGIFHAFSGSLTDAFRAMEMGFLLGIGGVVTYPRSGLAETLSKAGFKKLVLETDSPYLTPVPHRGKRNESVYVTLIARKLAEIFDTDLENIADITSRNARDLFRLT
jgi:TatD DNase family protein